MVDLNATQAAIRAGYSKRRASEIGYQLLRKTTVRGAIQKAMDERVQRTGIEAERVLTEIGRVALVDPRKIFDDQGRLLPIHDLPPEVAASVSSFEVVTSRVPGSDPVEVEHTVRIRFWNKLSALDLAGRHLGLFIDKVEHSGDVGVRVRFERIDPRHEEPLELLGREDIPVKSEA